MNANKDGVLYNMNSQTTNFDVKKVINSSGILSLELKAATNDESIRVVLPYYVGKKIYLMGDNLMLPNFMDYEIISLNSKRTCNHPGTSMTDKNYIEITSDHGKFIEGNFDFNAQNSQNLSYVRFSEGTFKVIAH